MMSESPRYPQAKVRLRSRNPLALIGAVRAALRGAGVGAAEVRDFSHQAAEIPPQEVETLCRKWAHLEIELPSFKRPQPETQP